MLLRVIVAIFCLAALGAFALGRYAGRLATFALNRAGCRFTAEASGLSYFPPRFWAKGVSFRQGREADTAIVAKVESLETPLSLLPLFAGKIRLGLVELVGPRVEVIEGEGKSSGESGATPDLRVEGVRIQRGEFRYRHIYSDAAAEIVVRDIDGALGALDARSSASVPGQVTARLEASGAVNLKVDAAYFAPTPDVHVRLEIRHQELADLNRYFTPADGLKLKGKLKLGQGEVSLRGDELSARVLIHYEQFDLLMEANRDRSGIGAFFANLLRGLKIDDENLTEPRYDQRHAVKLRRRQGESVVSSLVRALREAALQIATT